jgi:endonuclease/exonuclease/phosphatase family metal-dependent hydrolase
MTPDNPSWSKIASSHQSVFGSQLKTTFNMKRKKLPGYASAAVDVVLLSPEIAVRTAECLNLDISDHLPLVVEIEV